MFVVLRGRANACKAAADAAARRRPAAVPTSPQQAQGTQQGAAGCPRQASSPCPWRFLHRASAGAHYVAGLCPGGCTPVSLSGTSPVAAAGAALSVRQIHPQSGGRSVLPVMIVAAGAATLRAIRREPHQKYIRRPGGCMAPFHLRYSFAHVRRAKWASGLARLARGERLEARMAAAHEREMFLRTSSHSNKLI